MTWSDSQGKPRCKCSTSHKSWRRASLDLNLNTLKNDDTSVHWLYSPKSVAVCGASVCVLGGGFCMCVCVCVGGSCGVFVLHPPSLH